MGCTESVVDVEVQVCNRGEQGGDHVVLVFAEPPQGGEGGVPQQQLGGYGRVRVEAGACVDTVVSVGVRGFVYADETGRLTSHAGEWVLRVGEPAQLTHTVSIV